MIPCKKLHNGFVLAPRFSRSGLVNMPPAADGLHSSVWKFLDGPRKCSIHSHFSHRRWHAWLGVKLEFGWPFSFFSACPFTHFTIAARIACSIRESIRCLAPDRAVLGETFLLAIASLIPM